MHSQLFRWAYTELEFTTRGGVYDLRVAGTLDMIKMNPSFGPVLRLLFRQPLESRSIYIDLRVLAAHLRMNFLQSKLLRWVYKEHKLYRERSGV